MRRGARVFCSPVRGMKLRVFMTFSHGLAFREVFAGDDEYDWRERIKSRNPDYARLVPIKRDYRGTKWSNVVRTSQYDFCRREIFKFPSAITFTMKTCRRININDIFSQRVKKRKRNKERI